MNAELAASEFTPEQARRFTDELRQDGRELWRKVRQAFEGGIWIALGYEPGRSGWDRYVAEELNRDVLAPPKESQNDALREYLDAGMSTRVISSVMDLSKDTINRRIKEIREETGVSDETPAKVRGIDGKTYAASRAQPQRQEVEAEIVIDDEQPQARPHSPAPAVPDDGTPLSERPAGDFGLAEIDIDLDRPTHHVSAQTVRETIRNYAHTASSGLSTAKKGATDLAMYLTSGLVTIDSWNEGELSEVAEDTADTVKVLSSLLKDMADGTATRGMSRRALLADDTMRHLQEAVSNLSLVRSVIEKEVTA